jgi:glutaredoxin
MSKTIYVFELECPHCGRTSELIASKEDPPPKLYCLECLEQRRKSVELTIVRVTVQPNRSRHHV